jgi:hypothetical protein
VNLRDTLHSIKAKRGELTPEVLLEEARPVNAPAHKFFDWDKDQNAKRWLLHQAHRLIQQVEITYTKADGKVTRVREFHAVKQDNNRYVYESVDDLRQDPISREIVLRDMEREWIRFRQRYEQFEEFWDLIKVSKERSE